MLLRILKVALIVALMVSVAFQMPGYYRLLQTQSYWPAGAILTIVVTLLNLFVAGWEAFRFPTFDIWEDIIYIPAASVNVKWIGKLLFGCYWAALILWSFDVLPLLLGLSLFALYLTYESCASLFFRLRDRQYDPGRQTSGEG